MEEKHPGLPPEINTEDPIAQFLTKLLTFCVQNAGKLVLAGLCLTACIAGGAGFIAWKTKQETRAAADLGILILEAGKSGEDAKLLTDLEKIGEEKASSRAGQIAQLYTARLFAEKGENASALESYNKAFASLGSDPFLKKMILWERAYIHLALGDTKAALSAFSELTSEKSAYQESALYHVFRLEVAAGNRENGDAAYARLLELYPDSFYNLFDI